MEKEELGVDRDVRADEAWKGNIKRTYDEMQQESLETVRQCREERAQLNKQYRQQSDDLHVIIVQALANLAENSNLAAKRSLDHWDNASAVASTSSGAVMDSMIDQSPPDEGTRQAPTRTRKAAKEK